MKRFRDQLLCGALGLLGIAAPAALIDHATYGISPAVVLVGVMFASVVGYGFGAWNVIKAYQEEMEEPTDSDPEAQE